MNPITSAGQQTFSRIKLVLIAVVAMVGLLAVRTYGQLPSGYDQRPRVDTAGNIVDAHEGMIAKFGDTYYLYGTAYEHTAGFAYVPYTNHYRCYTSTDLKNWTLTTDHLLKTSAGGIDTDPPPGVYYLPKVIYNAQNNNYVLWYNWWTKIYSRLARNDGAVSLGVAVSSSP